MLSTNFNASSLIKNSLLLIMSHIFRRLYEKNWNKTKCSIRYTVITWNKSETKSKKWANISWRELKSWNWSRFKDNRKLPVDLWLRQAKAKAKKQAILWIAKAKAELARRPVDWSFRVTVPTIGDDLLFMLKIVIVMIDRETRYSFWT